MDTLKYVRFWEERLGRMDGVDQGFARAEFLLEQWLQFGSFVNRVGMDDEPVIDAFRSLVFGVAEDGYRQAAASEGMTVAVCIGLARCLKAQGRFDEAAEAIRSGMKQLPRDAQLLSELADVSALVNDSRAARALFREAFFVDPDAIELGFLESQLIRALEQTARDAGHAEGALKEWIPVYAVLRHEFTVTRELRPIEYGQLLQSIYALERDYSDRRSNSWLVPRLLNRYFWLVDHLRGSGAEQTRIEEVMLKIRSLDQTIYEEYRN